MRLWSLHPSYLDAVGLVALWREGLLARKVLQGQTKGYIHHPQLFRFRETGNPIHVLDFYLKPVHDESIRRGYNFDLSKISPCESRPPSLLLPDKQLEYEFLHLLDKLKERSPRQYSLLRATAVAPPQPRVPIAPGGCGSWERTPVSAVTVLHFLLRERLPSNKYFWNAPLFPLETIDPVWHLFIVTGITPQTYAISIS
ncbi:MAG: pyrimidine dimer DNA glycosylase/endonuclease V, partial [Akkermansia sp.]|nr:pyrimidine dimer DNA glycosylase/endonuclease V [Akkermansia sp.]